MKLPKPKMVQFRQCTTHPDVEMVVFCPACRGSMRSRRKAKSSAANGKLGGRPRKQQVLIPG